MTIHGLTHGLRRERSAVDFYHNLGMPILPGDRSLVDITAEDLRYKLINVGHSLHDALFLSTTLGTSLFSVVVLRCYLERSPHNDATIYLLLKTGSLLSTDLNVRPFITCHLSIPEAALAAVRQLNEDEHRDHNLWRTLQLEDSDPIEHDPSHDCTIKHPIAYIHSPEGTTFEWPDSMDTGLTTTFKTPSNRTLHPEPLSLPPPEPSVISPYPHNLHSKDTAMDTSTGSPTRSEQLPPHRRKRSEATSEESTSAGLSARLPAAADSNQQSSKHTVEDSSVGL